MAEIFRMMTESRAQWWDVNVDEVRKLVDARLRAEGLSGAMHRLELAGSVSIAKVMGYDGLVICKLMVKDNGKLELIS